MGSTEIKDVAQSDSTLTIEAKVIGNCGFSFLCDIEVVKDTILNLIHHGYGSHADCSCCFGLTYKILRFHDVDDVTAPTYVMIGGNRATLKMLPS